MIRRRLALIAAIAMLLAACGIGGRPAPGDQRADGRPAPGDQGAVLGRPSPLPPPSSCAQTGASLMAGAVRPSPAIPVHRPGSEQTPAPVPARGVHELVASVGVNVHLTYNNTPYGDYDRVADALRTLGIGHIRDGLVPGRDNDQYPFLRRLADEGVCANLIVGDREADDGRIASALDDVRKVAVAVDLLEGPNEPDLALGDAWRDRLPRYQKRLAERVTAGSAVSDVPLLGPSFGRMGALREAADLSLPHDIVNIHPYPGGGPPSQHLSDNIAAAQATDGTPIVATEHGYHNALASTAGHPGVPEDVAAVYIPRLFLESFATGVVRTYLYELVDQFENPGDNDAEAQFGLLRNDFSPKPAATALRNLMTVLGGNSVRPHTTGSLPVMVETDAGDVTAILLQGFDGTWWVALWRQASVFDQDRQQPNEVEDAAATVVVDRPVDATVFRPLHGLEGQPRAHSQPRVPVDVPADPLLIAIHPDG